MSSAIRPARQSRSFRWLALFASLLMLGGCGTQPPTTEESGGPGVAFQQAFPRVTCGGPPGFDPALLDEPGRAEQGNDPTASALRAALVPKEGETDVLPDTGWVEVTRTDDLVKFIADGGDGPGLAIVTIQQRDGQWLPDVSGRCDLRPELRDGLNLAQFRVAPHEQLTADTTELDVLVLEGACTSGEDAQGRIVEPTIVRGSDALTVVFATVPLDGAAECEITPETPFVLELPEPLGDRMLLDGSSIPPRDATTCHPRVCP